MCAHLLACLFWGSSSSLLFGPAHLLSSGAALRGNLTAHWSLSYNFTSLASKRRA